MLGRGRHFGRKKGRKEALEIKLKVNTASLGFWDEFWTSPQDETSDILGDFLKTTITKVHSQVEKFGLDQK